MTNKKIESFIRKNIIGCIGHDLIQKGTYILKRPSNDILGGFCFEPSASDKNSTYIWWFVQPLFIPINTLHLTYGGRLEQFNHDQSWTDLDSAKTIETIIDVINHKKKLVESLLEPRSFYDYFNKKNKDSLRIYEALVYVSIRIESVNWKEEIQDFITLVDDKFDVSIPWIGKIKNDLINISLSDNPQKILEDNKRNLLNFFIS